MFMVSSIIASVAIIGIATMFIKHSYHQALFAVTLNPKRSVDGVLLSLPLHRRFTSLEDFDVVTRMLQHDAVIYSLYNMYIYIYI